MSNPPPRKKLRQLSVLSLLSRSTGKSPKVNTKMKEDCTSLEGSSGFRSKGEEETQRQHSTKSPKSPEKKRPLASPKKEKNFDKGSSSSNKDEDAIRENKERNLKVSPQKRKEPKKKASPQKSKDSNSAENRRKKMADAAERRQEKGAGARKETFHNLSPPASPDMFADSQEEEKEKEKITWQGTPVSILSALSKNNLNVPPVKTSPDHSILVKLPISYSDTASPSPYPSQYMDCWDQHHVKMPCSPESLCPLKKSPNTLVERWSVICKALQRDIKNVDELRDAILEYNTRYTSKWRFIGLKYLLEEELEDEESEYFFNHTLPAMVRLALSLPQVVTQPPPLLKQGMTHSMTLTQLQVAVLLANAFFCTFPRRNAHGNNTEYCRYPDINFNRLFFHKLPRALEKMKCLLNYFRRVTTKEPVGTITFTRQHLKYGELPEWEMLKDSLPRLHMDSNGLIEDSTGLLQVDFANKFLGGGVLGLGCVQEEIRFVLSPELLVTRLFTEALNKSEALIITGVEQYSSGTGYSSSFQWAGNFVDKTSRDPWGRLLCQVVAIDALHFSRQPEAQYSSKAIIRELNKAYAGFKLLPGAKGHPIAVATGNWGCGAFKGDPRLKALIQLAAGGRSSRDIAYYTFGDRKLRDDVIAMHTFLQENKVSVGELVQSLKHYAMSRKDVDGSDLYHYIYYNLGAYQSDTDEEDNSKVSDLPKTTKESNTISQYFKKISEASSSCSDKNKNNSSSKPSPSDTSSGKHHQFHFKVTKSSSTKSNSHSSKTISSNITEAKISEVLSECDRLVEDKHISALRNLYKEERSCSDEGECEKESEKETSRGKEKKEVEGEEVDRDGSTSKEDISSSFWNALDQIDKDTGT